MNIALLGCCSLLHGCRRCIHCKVCKLGRAAAAVGRGHRPGRSAAPDFMVWRYLALEAQSALWVSRGVTEAAKGRPESRCLLIPPGVIPRRVNKPAPTRMMKTEQWFIHLNTFKMIHASRLTNVSQNLKHHLLRLRYLFH